MISVIATKMRKKTSGVDMVCLFLWYPLLLGALVP